MTVDDQVKIEVERITPQPGDVVVLRLRGVTWISHEAMKAVVDSLDAALPDGVRGVVVEGSAELTVEQIQTDALEHITSQRDTLAGGIRSFLTSLPYQPPEALGQMAASKLGGALAGAGLALEPERMGSPADDGATP